MDEKMNYAGEMPMGLIRDTVGGRDSISNNFAYHKPGEAIEAKHEMVRALLCGVAREMDSILPRGREASLVQTKLEEAMFWGNAAIARDQR